MRAASDQVVWDLMAELLHQIQPKGADQERYDQATVIADQTKRMGNSKQRHKQHLKRNHKVSQDQDEE